MQISYVTNRRIRIPRWGIFHQGRGGVDSERLWMIIFENPLRARVIFWRELSFENALNNYYTILNDDGVQSKSSLNDRTESMSCQFLCDYHAW